MDMSTFSMEKHQLTGRSLIAGETAAGHGETFFGFNPVDGRALEQEFFSASIEDVDCAVNAALEAFAALAESTGKERSALLRSIAAAIEAAAPQLAEQAHLETALPRTPRLAGEIARTTGQLRLFAAMVEEGSWVQAHIDTADANRTPPRPDLRSMLRPLGPVAVFGASNFPFAFSVAGGDTASALAAGNPVIVKAHPAHPGTSELVGRIVSDAVKASGFPAGVFSLLFDRGHQVGAALVQHPGVRAVGFTGSLRGGRALMDLAAQRHEPIPVYAEMGSTNPVFILPGALQQRGEDLAASLHGSFTLAGGQQCTKPGVIFAPTASADGFVDKLRTATRGDAAFSLLTAGIAHAYKRAIAGRSELLTAEGAPAQDSADGHWASPGLFETTSDHFFANADLGEEVFGPATLLVHCSGIEEMLRAAHSLEGHLTATVIGTDDDLMQNKQLLRVLETKAGRLICNGVPTGVDVCDAMIHGGPYPATSDGRSTSVGNQAIYRFTRPVAYQNWPQAVLPPELQDVNPLGITRLWNGKLIPAPTS